MPDAIASSSTVPMSESTDTLDVPTHPLVRVKSFTQTADLLGHATESSRPPSRQATPDTTPHNLADLLRDLRERRQREERDVDVTRHYQGHPAPPRPIRPRQEPEPAHLAAFDRDLQLAGLNELGVVQDRYHPSARRPRTEFMSPRSSTPLSTTSDDVNLASSHRTHSPGPNHPIPSLVDVPSVPPPRQDRDSLDFSPQRQMRDDREVSRQRRMLEDTIRDLESDAPSTSFRSRYHRERLARLDALRTQDRAQPGFGDPDAPYRIGEWNRDVQDAMNRRLPDVPLYAPRRPRADDLWGELPDAAGRSDPMDLFGDSNMRRPFRLQRSFDPPINLLGHSLQLPPPQHSFFDHDWLNRHSHERVPHPPTPALFPPSFKPEMTEAERMRLVEVVAKGVTRWPYDMRRKMAEKFLEHVTWSEWQEDFPRDEYCSVCHDEYEEISKVTVTPCKHMYHAGCLQTWLQTPNTSSCPMCRRDLAVLTCLTKMVPNKQRQEAMPMWMAL